MITAMILVDTGVIIAFLRTKDPKLDALFRALPVAVCELDRIAQPFGAFADGWGTFGNVETA
jgi:hypothetical protein